MDQSEVFNLWNGIQALSLEERVLKFYQVLCPQPEAETPIELLPAPDATIRLLQRNGIQTIERLRELRWGDLLALRGIGDTKAYTIRRALEKLA